MKIDLILPSLGCFIYFILFNAEYSLKALKTGGSITLDQLFIKKAFSIVIILI